MVDMLGDLSLDFDEVRHRTLESMFTNLGYLYYDFFYALERLPLLDLEVDSQVGQRAEPDVLVLEAGQRVLLGRGGARVDEGAQLRLVAPRRLRGGHVLRERLRSYKDRFVAREGRGPCGEAEWRELWPAYLGYAGLAQQRGPGPDDAVRALARKLEQVEAVLGSLKQ